MKLSEQLKQDHDCGDYRKGLEGYSQRAKNMEDIIEELTNCLEATYSGSPEGREYLAKARKTIDA